MKAIGKGNWPVGGPVPHHWKILLVADYLVGKGKEYIGIGTGSLCLFQQAIRFAYVCQSSLIPAPVLLQSFDYLVSKGLKVLRVCAKVIHRLRPCQSGGVNRCDAKKQHSLSDIVSSAYSPVAASIIYWKISAGF